jgi:hypothetical protein
MTDVLKIVKREVRELGAKVYEAELTLELNKLHEQFEAWKAGSITCWDLNDLIHKFHNGVSRKMWGFYSGRQPEFEVVYGLNHGLLDKSEISETTWPYIERLMPLLSDNEPEEAGAE